MRKFVKGLKKEKEVMSDIFRELRKVTREAYPERFINSGGNDVSKITALCKNVYELYSSNTENALNHFLNRLRFKEVILTIIAFSLYISSAQAACDFIINIGDKKTKLVEKIAEPENSLTVVGDDDQCIYAFRQANIQNIQQ